MIHSEAQSYMATMNPLAVKRKKIMTTTTMAI
jgi:hypothetical protein